MRTGLWKLLAVSAVAAGGACQIVGGIEDLPVGTAATEVDGSSEGGADGFTDVGETNDSAEDSSAADVDAASDGALDGAVEGKGDAQTAQDAASCPGLPATCGPTASSDCCASPLVTGGVFYRSFDAVAYTDMTKPATLSDFRLDQFEVTVGRFRKFVAAYPGSKPAAESGKNPHDPFDNGWDANWTNLLPSDQTALRADVLNGNCGGNVMWHDTPGNNPGVETMPMNCVTWYEAFAFCIWDGGRLPSEAEWNYAATGGSQQRVYPWSNPSASTTIDSSYAIYQSNPVRTVGISSPKGDSLFGQSDMAGNVREWVMDLNAAYPVPCNDCAILASATATYRVERGGYNADAPANIVASVRTWEPPGASNWPNGFRCARNP